MILDWLVVQPYLRRRYQQGYADGYAIGYAEGYAEARAEVFDKAQQRLQEWNARRLAAQADGKPFTEPLPPLPRGIGKGKWLPPGGPSRTRKPS